jgi:phosphoglycerol transferase MdoB-like AlkP superfamily enzyme
VRGERRVFFIIRILKGTATVFPYALGNTVQTQWRRLNIGLLLWGFFVAFSLFFPK